MTDWLTNETAERFREIWFSPEFSRASARSKRVRFLGGRETGPKRTGTEAKTRMFWVSEKQRKWVRYDDDDRRPTHRAGRYVVWFSRLLGPAHATASRERERFWGGFREFLINTAFRCDSSPSSNIGSKGKWWKCSKACLGCLFSFSRVTISLVLWRGRARGA